MGDRPRNFGVPAGQVVERESTILVTTIGTRLGTHTAY